MARPQSQQLAGYFPAPSRLLPSFASTLRWPERLDAGGTAYLLDPCAGEGAAIRALRDLWAATLASTRPDGSPAAARLAITAAELEEDRARALDASLDPYRDEVFHADAFRLLPRMEAATGATILYLNPPYDSDPEHGRLEHRFLLRFTAHLHPGSGLLLYLVPHGALEASADFLARQYLDLRCYRLPDPEYRAFGQVLLLGRRARRPLPSAAFAATILRWARDPESLPVLPERCPDPIAVDPDPDTSYDCRYQLEEIDLTAALDAFRPWQGTPTGVERSARDLLGARFATAVPPRAAHIALALAAGMFNGHELTPNDPGRHPPLLAKGVFERTPVEVSRRVDQDGATTAIVEIEQPSLHLTILRLDTFTFHTLAPGTVPTGDDDPARWNAADLIAGYDRSLAALLARQFPPLHDPQDPAGQIALPRLARTPFRAQHQAIQAALKLLARGANPFLVAEVGTGKSTLALFLAAALSSDHHADTSAELARVGLPARLPVVRKTLVVCPPHLLKSWTDQVAAVLPGARVQVLASPGDLDRPADVYLLSREAAKLGHAWGGVEGRCPRCGADLLESARTSASRRLRCQAQPRRARDLPARLAETLAHLLVPAFSGRSLVFGLAGRAALARGLEGEARPLFLGGFLDFQGTVLHELAEALRQVPSPQMTRTVLFLADLLPDLAGALGTGRETLAFLADLASRLPGQAGDPSSPWTRAGALRLAVGRIEAQLQEGEPPAVPSEESVEDRRQATLPSAADSLLRLLETLHGAGTWAEGPPCNEPLFQAVPRPRRTPLARYILRRHRRDFGIVLLDEVHEYNQPASAQSKAAHRLTSLPGVPTVVLSGSLMGGYASSLFANFWALSPGFRQEFGRDERSAFVARYGYRKLETRLSETASERTLGQQTDRELDGRRVVGEAPGILPTFLLRHLLPTAVLLHKEDLDVDLPPLAEEPAPVQAPPDDPLAAELLDEYRRLQDRLLACIRADRFDPDRAGRLLGALVELPSYLDRATDDLEPFEVRYPEELGSESIATGRAFPAAWTTPKERWLLSEVEAARARGERVLVFLRHTGTGALPRRLLRLFAEVAPRSAFLDAKKVPSAKREAWIDEHVLARDVDVLLVNPNAVRTGLNNLVAFSVGLWYEMDLSATTYRQANGRLHRIGQTRPVTVKTAYYLGTAQEVTFHLIARKITASLQVDGLDLQASLEAAGASEEHTASLAAALSLGQAVYQALIGAAESSRT